MNKSATSRGQRDEAALNDHEPVPLESTHGVVVELRECALRVGDQAERLRAALPE